jgi:Spy/CpxP family protein refolding chaperone
MVVLNGHVLTALTLTDSGCPACGSAACLGREIKPMKFLAAAICLSCLAQVAFAQSPYAGMQTRTINALSEQQIADLKAGRGMGLALPAELNGYPGPAHVLELSDQLGLSAEQKARIQSLFDSMKAEAVPLGERLLEQEAALDQQFASRSVTPESLKAATAAIGVTQGELRETHLKYHLQTTQILTPDQMERYSTLRGYGSTVPTQHQHQRNMQ